ncbi:MAG: aldo/keto reductase [Clostridia bacterium]|nr:aldo/keto reductase [Clostridia bacterium]
MFENVFTSEKKLGFGLMRLPLLDSNDSGSVDIETLKGMVDSFIEQGFTYFDTAWMYCAFKSEEAVKEALVSRYPRDKFTLATKLHAGFLNSAEDMDRIFNEQLRKTGAEFFDYYLVHDINSHSINKYNRFDIWSWIQDKKEKGLVKHIGFSFHDGPELLDEVLTAHPFFEFVQIQLNYLDWNSAGVQSKKCYDICVKHNKPVITMETIKGGLLSNISPEAEKLYKEYNADMSVSSWAVRFAASLENVKIVLSGMSTPEQLADNTSYMRDFRPLNKEEQELVSRVTEIIESENAIPCTGCSYCTDGCPMNIAIPKYFSAYNGEKKENPDGSKGWTPSSEYYDNLAANFGKASECIACGQCEAICPQHLPVIENLKLVTKTFEK